MKNSVFLSTNISTASALPVVLALGLLTLATPVHAQYTEVESNNVKNSANVINLGAGSSATISGNSASNATTEYDYYQINTAYTTPGIYRNQIQLNNTAVTGSIRGLSQSGGVITPGTDVQLQTSLGSGTATPYGFNQYYSFGGAGKTQSVYYRAAGAGTSTGGAYTATFSSTRITPTSLGTFAQGNINFDSLTNLGTGGSTTNTEIVILNSNYDVYYDNVASSPTFGYAAMNDGVSSADFGFNLNRFFSPGTYYIAVGLSNTATNDAAPPDEVSTSRNSPVLDFDNVIVHNSTFYNGNNGNNRPTDFTITDTNGNSITTSGEQIQSLYAMNFYSFTVSSATVVPEPGTVTLLMLGGLGMGALALRHRRARAKHSA